MQFIKDFLLKREINKLKKKIAKLQSEALYLQRNGKLRLYASAMKEIDELSNSLVEKLDKDSELSHNDNVNDFIDYDGMGNQGRFPSDKKK